MTITPFEDRLLSELRHVVAARPAPDVATPGPRRGRFLLAGAVATGAATALILTAGGDGTAAYAVTTAPSGSVTVKIRSLDDADGLQSKLRANGVPAVVRYGSATCRGLRTGGPGSRSARVDRTGAGPSLSQSGAPPTGAARKSTTLITVDQEGAVTFTLDPGSLDAGDKVYVTTSGSADVGSVAVGIGAKDPC